MKNPDLKIPEPSLPEHLLIRDAAPTPVLSKGFKSRVMSECSSSISQAKKIWRMKVTGAIATLCCLSLVIAMCLPESPEQSSELTVRPAPEPHTSHGTSIGYDGAPSIAVDNPKPVSNDKPDDPSQLIEELENRMLDANILF